MIWDVLISALMLTGSILIFLAAIGIVRFADALCRSHALAKASTFGICLVLLALLVAADDDISRLKILLVIAFSLFTIPLAGHLISMLGYRQSARRHQDESLDR